MKKNLLVELLDVLRKRGEKKQRKGKTKQKRKKGGRWGEKENSPSYAQVSEDYWDQKVE